MKKTFWFYSLGCRVNQAEKEEMERQLLLLGFRPEKRKPAFFFLNTCAVTAKAERESRQLLYRLKKESPQSKIIVLGCAATKWLKEGKKIKEADFLFENSQKEDLPFLFSQKIGLLQASSPKKTLEPFSPEKFSLVQEADKYLSSRRLLLKIQDGCNFFCSYCLVPYLRGKPKFFSAQNLVEKIRLFSPFLQEVILTAVNSALYGQESGQTLFTLVQAILQKTSVPRISFGSLHPQSLTPQFLSLWENKRLVAFFHLPLQSGSNKILSLMRRGYTREEFQEKISFLQKVSPLAFLGTDIIVGFLGETERDFAETYQFLAQSPIAKFHLFRFSPREKTAAFFLAKKIPPPSPAITLKRAKTLAALGREKYQKFLTSLLGKAFSALFLNKGEENCQEVLLSNQVPALVQNGKKFAGEIKRVKIEKIKNGRLWGKII